MSVKSLTRRSFLQTSAAAAAAGSVPYWFSTATAQALDFKNPTDRPIVGCIGTGDRWMGGVGPNVMQLGDVVAVCDVDSNHANQGGEKVGELRGGKGKNYDVEVHEDYRRILDRDDIDVVTIVTPDHWHSKIAIEAMKAGKDVYCEKPLTLTIEEGIQIRKVLKETGRVFQVGTQQRSEMGKRFLQAVALVKDGRIGQVKTVHAVIGGGPVDGPFEVLSSPPSELNWDMWLGQAPMTPYIEKRVHYQFRWWYEYSGGKMTDWGAHHVDIAQWAIGMDNSGPISVEGETAEHPCEFRDGHPVVTNVYNAATSFRIRCKFPNGVDLVIMHNDEENNVGNGILFMGEKGRFLVTRSKVVGKPVEDLESNPLPDDAMTKVYKGKQIADHNAHMVNFFECLKTREQPISDVDTHHRAMTTCHLANIAIRLGRKLNWDPETEQIVGDNETRMWQAREQRRGYEIEA